MQIEDMISRSEMAKRLGINIRTTDNWHSRGIGPRRVRVGRNVFYSAEDVAAWTTKLSDRSHMSPKELAKALDLKELKPLAENGFTVEDEVDLAEFRRWARHESISYLAAAIGCPASRLSDLVG